MATKRETILARIASVLAGTTGVSDRILEVVQQHLQGQKPQVLLLNRRMM